MTKRLFTLVLSMSCVLYMTAQKNTVETLPLSADGKIAHCASVEYNEHLRQENPNRATIQQFEKWMSKQRTVLAQQQNQKSNEAPEIFTIPIVFHIINRGERVGSGTNIAAELVYEQIAQLNRDFRRIQGTLGFSNHPDAADTQIEFCPALYDEAGNEMAEPGINRINALTHFPPIGAGYYTGLVEFDDLVKKNTYWNPDEYMNFWVAELVQVLLGYAQFPEAPCLGGIGTGNGDASTDGVVCNYSTIGGENLPGANGTSSGLGRTATHEIGHWLGLRHIWGDGGCTASDFCEDTPNAADSNSGCAVNANSCDDSSNPYFNGADPGDMVENYMDYSSDGCMNLFTNVQRDRMRIVMGELTGRDCEGGSPRRASLALSSKCTPVNNNPLFSHGNLNENTAAPVETKRLIASVFPNPATDQVVVTLNDEFENATIQTRNQLGQVVDIDVISQGRQFELNTSNLSSGVYFVVLENGKNREVRRVVISR